MVRGEAEAIEFLVKLFGYVDGIWERKDEAFVWVDSPAICKKYGGGVFKQRYGSFKVIKREWLCGRRYRISLTDTLPTSVLISLLDTLYDPRTYSNDLPLDPKGIR